MRQLQLDIEPQLDARISDFSGPSWGHVQMKREFPNRPGPRLGACSIGRKIRREAGPAFGASAVCGS